MCLNLGIWINFEAKHLQAFIDKMCCLHLGSVAILLEFLQFVEDFAQNVQSRKNGLVQKVKCLMHA